MIFTDEYLYIDLENAKVLVEGQECAITPTEFRLLRQFLLNQGQLLTYDLLLERLWDSGGQFVDKHALAVNVNRLEEKLKMKNIDIFQMYTGWDINGLVDDCNNRNLIGNIVNCIMGKHQMQKEAELFASQVEEALDAILSGRKWKVKEELEDSLWGRTGTQLAKAEAVFLKKAEESFARKRNRERLNFRYVASDKNTDCQYEAVYGTS